MIKKKERVMTFISATDLRKDLYRTMTQVNESCTPIMVTNSKGKGVVLVGEDEWAAIEETLYLMGVPGMAESLIEGKNASLDECVSEDELDW